MRIVCPHCQVKGKVKDDLIGRKVRCPKCKEIFVVEADEKAIPPIIETIAEVTTETPTAENHSSAEPNTLITCTKCGFTFNEQFIIANGEEKLCSVCAL
ncbi:MAG: zinc-ribbon domain-containing protein [Desulfotalea sp.]